MSLKSRINVAFSRLGIDKQKVVPIIWSEKNAERARWQVEKALAANHRIALICFGLLATTHSRANAEKMVAAHRAKEGFPTSITVKRCGKKEEVLAEWEAPLPAWLSKALGR